MRSISRIVSVVAMLALGTAVPARAARPRDAGVRADSLHRRALGHLAEDTIESRRSALRELEAAVLLAPARVEWWRDLAGLCQLIGYHSRARACLQRIATLTPDDGDAQSALGLGWKWEWLATADDSAYASAVRCLLRAAALAPRDLEARLALVALALARGNAKLTSLAAQSAIACDHEAPEAQLAFACAAYWEGDLPLAESAFREAIPRLSSEARRHFAEFAPIDPRDPEAPETPAGSSAATAAAFWRELDPDLTTAENEVELDFMARTANALLLFRDPSGVRWDMRAELFVRYGAPGAIVPAPPGRDLALHVQRHIDAETIYLPAELDFPFNLQTWSYPSLGMHVELWDRSLRQRYEIPYSDVPGRQPTPDLALIAGRADLVVLGNGRGVYRGLPPGISPMPARGALSRFPESSGTRLVAHLETPGGPTDSLWGRWVVIASDGREVARGAGMLSISACEPTERRVAQFTASVPPGDYRVDLAVSDGARRRGVVHLSEHVVARSESLAMSDLVLLCGPRSRFAVGGPVLIEPNLEQRLHATSELSVYFEMDGLTVGEDGRATFDYAYALRPVGREGRSPRPVQPVFQASREESNVGGHRRQFVSAPIADLASGGYELEITVRDLRSGAAATRAVRFEKD